MIDSLQKLFLAGIGATATTAEAVKKTLDEMVEKGKISAEEAGEYSQKMMDEGRKEFEKAQHEAQDFFKSLLNKANFATQDDLKALKDQVAALEARISAMEGSETTAEDTASES